METFHQDIQLGFSESATTVGGLKEVCAFVLARPTELCPWLARHTGIRPSIHHSQYLPYYLRTMGHVKDEAAIGLCVLWTLIDTMQPGITSALGTGVGVCLIKFLRHFRDRGLVRHEPPRSRGPGPHSPASAWPYGPEPRMGHSSWSRARIRPR